MHKTVMPRTDEEIMKLAKKRVKIKAEFVSHLVSYLLINGFLTLICLISGSRYFWPIWPMAGWGLGLAFHAFAVYHELSNVYGNKIDEEYTRLKKLLQDDVNYDYYQKDELLCESREN